MVHTRRRLVLVSSCELAMVVVVAEESGKREFGGMAKGKGKGGTEATSTADLHALSAC